MGENLSLEVCVHPRVVGLETGEELEGFDSLMDGHAAAVDYAAACGLCRASSSISSGDLAVLGTVLGYSRIRVDVPNCTPVKCHFP